MLLRSAIFFGIEEEINIFNYSNLNEKKKVLNFNLKKYEETFQTGYLKI